MSLLPNRAQAIVNDDLTASNEMRAWMETGFVETSGSSNYTANNYDEINATLSAVITLPTSGKVKVNNIDGTVVTVNLSASQTIFGENSVQIQSKGSVIFKHLINSNQWVFE